MDVNLWLVTGWRGSGKTTFCQKMLQVARLAGWDTAGLLSPAVFQDGIKDSILAEEIRSGEKRLLAAAHPQTETDLVFGNWYFNRKTLEWGNHVLQSSIPCGLLVIDELGPLEFNLSLGWVRALEVIKTAQFRLALVVIRPELLASAQNIFHPIHTIQMDGVDKVDERVLQFTPGLIRLKDALQKISFKKWNTYEADANPLR
jgi:nucleoside-triphosphatase THEP1